MQLFREKISEYCIVYSYIEILMTNPEINSNNFYNTYYIFDKN